MTPFQVREAELERVWARIQEIDTAQRASRPTTSAQSLEREFGDFLSCLPGKPDLQTCQPNDIRAFLVWKDKDGKTPIHRTDCQNLATARPSASQQCTCPTRLAHSTVTGLVSRIRALLNLEGRQNQWDPRNLTGNPASSPCVAQYAKYVAEEQAKAHVIPKQAIPIFGAKVGRLIRHIMGKKVTKTDVLSETYIWKRDAALFRLLCFGGDRAGDIGHLKFQEVKQIPGSNSLLVTRSFGKTLRGGQSNTYVLHKTADKAICPVLGLQDLHLCMSGMGIPTLGYIFRPVGKTGNVRDEPMKYTAINNRLRLYLTEMEEHTGETPHSFRAGCAISMVVGEASKSAATVMSHIGWASEKMLEKYSRAGLLLEGSAAAENLSEIVSSGTSQIEETYARFGDPMNLPVAFTVARSSKEPL